MSRVSRHDDGWRMHALGESCGGTSYAQMLPEILSRL
jgi:stress response protein SCP2